MAYMENAHKSIDIQELKNGQWITIVSDVGTDGYLIHLKRMGSNPNYRAIRPDGSVISNPHDLLSNCEVE